jgi:hypothetical protein
LILPGLQLDAMKMIVRKKITFFILDMIFLLIFQLFLFT